MSRSARSPQRVQGSRILLLFALLAAVFAMHALDGSHDLNSAPAISSTVAAPVHAVETAIVATTHHHGTASHEMDHAGGACLALLVGAAASLALVYSRPTAGSWLFRPAALARFNDDAGSRSATGPPDLTVMSVSRT